MLPVLREFWARQFRLGGETGPLFVSGTGSPEGVVTAPVGSVYSRKDGGADSTIYRKESGSGNTGWTAISNAGGALIRGVATLDFGAAGSSDTAVEVTAQTSIAGGVHPMVRVAYLDSPDHSADEHLAEDMDVYAGAAVAGVGFTIFGVARNVALFGRWNVAWSY